MNKKLIIFKFFITGKINSKDMILGELGRALKDHVNVVGKNFLILQESLFAC